MYYCPDGSDKETETEKLHNLSKVTWLLTEVEFEPQIIT